MSSEASGCSNKERALSWTEGTRGLGWARDAVPTLKGGSTVAPSNLEPRR
jgi:hypothetical protein